MSGNLFIVAAPSGAGKTTLVKRLLEVDAGVQLSISYTTRLPRPGEQDGREYHFVTPERFKAMQAEGEFLEWAEVYGNFYGTSRNWIAAQMAAGRDILLEIDWQGATQVREQFPSAIDIFILPPSLAELTRRLTGRGTDAPEVIARRLAVAKEEISHAGEFQYAIINNELHEALADLCAIVRAARMQVAPQRARHPEIFAGR